MEPAEEKMGYWPVVAIGIGGMVGGGIFAVLGLSVQITKGAAPLAFLAAGLVVMLLLAFAIEGAYRMWLRGNLFLAHLR